MSAQKYRKRPGEVEAMQWTGANLDDIWAWAGHDGIYGSTPQSPGQLVVTTICGDPAPVRIGDWILPEPQPGRFWPCPDAVFGTIYEPVSDHITAALERLTREHIEQGGRT